MSNKKNVQIPLNSPQTFLPERRLLSQLLPFAKQKGQGDKVSIGAETGIPTGESTGKVEPIIYYALGMGLINAAKVSGAWQLDLTPLGIVVLQEDPFLSENQSLWLLHLMLCRRNTLKTPATGIADPWFALFAEGGFRLGECFKQSDYFDFLVDRHGDISYLKSLASVVIRSYLEESCLGHIGVLQQTENDLVVRQIAPVTREFFPVYTSYLYLVWDELFPEDNQISLDSFSRETRCFLIMGWTEPMIANWLDWMVDNGMVQVDRYTGTPMLLRLKSTLQVLTATYSELI